MVFAYVYVSTVDKKKHTHRYKVLASDTTPFRNGEQETSRVPAVLTGKLQDVARFGTLR